MLFGQKNNKKCLQAKTNLPNRNVISNPSRKHTHKRARSAETGIKFNFPSTFLYLWPQENQS